MAANKEKVLILPASHEFSPSQLALVVFLREIGYRPDTILCSSGGSIAATIACSAGFERDFPEFKQRIDSLSNYISTKLYLSKHRKIITIPFSIYALLYPTIYNKGRDPKKTPFEFNLNQTSIIIGTKNVDSGVNTIWYTKEYPATSHGNYELKKIENSSDYLKIVRASSSIPGIVPPIKIKGMKYQDSGMDTICPLECVIDKYSIECHLIFAVPFNPFDCFLDRNLSDNIQETLKEVMGYRKNSKIKETFLQCLELLGNDESKIETNSGTSFHELIIALNNTDDCRKSIILIYPNKPYKVNLFNTRSGDYTKAMNNTYREGFSFSQYMVF